MSKVIFAIADQVELFDLAGPAQVFYEAASAGANYQIVYASIRQDVASAQGIALAKLEPLPEMPVAGDIVIVPGSSVLRSPGWPRENAPFLNWLRAAQSNGATVTSVCVGAFALGAAGLLDGRTCTTHWKYVDALQQRFPGAQVIANRLYVFDGTIATSAGIASGVDLALAIVERDQSARIAAVVAREMVVSVRRLGSQEQLSPYFSGRDHMIHEVHVVQDWLVDHPGAEFTLEALARRAGVSTRTLTRQFKAATGRTVNAYTTSLRLEYARSLLRDRSLTIDDVAERCGFADGRHLRRLWKAAYGTPPSAYRTSTPSSSALART